MNNDSHIAASKDVDKEKFTEMQESLYTIPDTMSEQEALDHIKCPFYYRTDDITTYSSPTVTEMESSIPNQALDDRTNKQLQQFVYSASGKYHRLLHCYITFKLPDIQVAPEYEDSVQIALCPNLMHNITNMAILRMPGYEQPIDTAFLDFYRSNDCPNIKNWDYMIGNRPELQEWDCVLKTRDELTLPLPFYIDMSPKYSVPIHLFPPRDGVEVLVRYSLMLENLLRMRIKDEKGVWHEIPPYLPFLETESKEIGIPKMWGIYRTVTDEQIADDSKGYSIIIPDIKYFTERVVEQNFSIDLTDKQRTIRGVRYGFLNLKAAYYNNHSNYTLSHQNSGVGDDPQEEYELTYGNIHRISKRGTIHSTAIVNHYNLYNNGGYHGGVHNIIFDFSPYNIYADTGVVLNKSSILSGSLRTKKSYPIQEEEKENKLKIRPSDSPDKVLKAVLSSHLILPKEKRDETISSQFLLKGFYKFFRRLTFKVGGVIVSD